MSSVFRSKYNVRSIQFQNVHSVVHDNRPVQNTSYWFQIAIVRRLFELESFTLD